VASLETGTPVGYFSTCGFITGCFGWGKQNDQKKGLTGP
jgi:hypothetical protein